jgi:hypothetical protein
MSGLFVMCDKCEACHQVELISECENCERNICMYCANKHHIEQDTNERKIKKCMMCDENYITKKQIIEKLLKIVNGKRTDKLIIDDIKEMILSEKNSNKCEMCHKACAWDNLWAYELCDHIMCDECFKQQHYDYTMEDQGKINHKCIFCENPKIVNKKTKSKFKKIQHNRCGWSFTRLVKNKNK